MNITHDIEAQLVQSNWDSQPINMSSSAATNISGQQLISTTPNCTPVVSAKQVQSSIVAWQIQVFTNISTIFVPVKYIQDVNVRK